jgi:hypothetical protein
MNVIALPPPSQHFMGGYHRRRHDARAAPESASDSEGFSACPHDFGGASFRERSDLY